MNKATLVAATFGVALILHISAGWMWTPLAGIFGGIAGKKSGWRIGAYGLGASWSVLVLYNLITATSEVVEMGRVLGELFGGLPGLLIFIFTALIGLLLGAVSGKLGTSLRSVFRNA